LSGDTINIRPSVDTSELESYLAMLDQALLKQDRLTASATDSLGSAAGGGVGGVRSSAARAVRDVQFANGQIDLLGNRVFNTKMEMKGLETFAMRVTRMIPGVREGARVVRNIDRMNNGYVAIAMLNLALITWRVVRMIDSHMQKLLREKQEMEAFIREVQGFNRAQYKEWQTSQSEGIRQTREAHRVIR